MPRMYASMPRFPLAEDAAAKPPPPPPSAEDLLSLAHLAWRGLPGQSVCTQAPALRSCEHKARAVATGVEGEGQRRRGTAALENWKEW